MSYSVYSALVRQAEVTGWFGVGLASFGLLLALVLVPYMIHRKRALERAGMQSSDWLTAAMFVLVLSTALIAIGASQARWLLNPRGYAVEHYDWGK